MASYDLRKFYSDCKDTLARIKDKMNNLPDDLGKDKKQVENLERKHDSFILDVQSLRDQVYTTISFVLYSDATLMCSYS